MSTNAIISSLAAKPLVSSDDIRAFSDAVTNLVRDPAFPTYEIPFALAPVVAAHPQVTESLFASLAGIGARLSVTQFLDALLDAGQEDVVLRALPSMGAVDPDNITVVERLTTRLTGRSGPFLMAYVTGWPSLSNWSDAFEKMALALPLDQLPGVIKTISSHIPPDRWSSRFFAATIAKHGVSCLPLFSSKSEPSAYNACAANADLICEAIKLNGQSTARPDALLAVLIDDPAFPALPSPSHSAVLRATSDLSDDEAARTLLLAFFASVKADRGLCPNDAAVQRMARGIPSPEQAMAIIQNWCKTGVQPYTFSGELLAHLLACAPSASFKALFWATLASSDSSSVRNELLSILARSNTHQFAYVYLKNRKRIHSRPYEMDSQEAKDLYQVCMNQLSFLDRLLMSFGLL
jgi:hypothetical protein